MSEPLIVLAQENHVTVVQTPGHSHPGIIIQGDALLVLYGSVRTTLEMLNNLEPKTAHLEEAILELQSVRDGLLERLAVLEQVMESLDMALPYTWSARIALENLKPKPQDEEGKDH
jgi:hypothetical protein